VVESRSYDEPPEPGPDADEIASEVVDAIDDRLREHPGDVLEAILAEVEARRELDAGRPLELEPGDDEDEDEP
jgi:hypothetical protein